jgi:ubiquinone/menaquinone biosynthesis C-methylase UbiE
MKKKERKVVRTKEELSQVWLNLGCGVSLADLPFINVDKFFTKEDLENGINKKDPLLVNARVPKGAKFVQADIAVHLPFEDNYADYIECNDAIEHMAMCEVIPALTEMYRVLKPGGKLAVSTTNFDELAKLWILNVTGKSLSTKEEIDRYITLSQVIYGNQAGPGEFHKVPFTPFSLGYYLQTAGFKLKDIVITVFPTNSPLMAHQKAYDHFSFDKGTVVLTEELLAEATK